MLITCGAEAACWFLLAEAACNLWSRALRARARRLSASSLFPQPPCRPFGFIKLGSPFSPRAAACSLLNWTSSAVKGLIIFTLTKTLCIVSETMETGPCIASGQK